MSWPDPPNAITNYMEKSQPSCHIIAKLNFCATDPSKLTPARLTGPAQLMYCNQALTLKMSLDTLHISEGPWKKEGRVKQNWLISEGV